MGQSICRHSKAFGSIIRPITPFNYVYFFKIMIAMLSNHNKLIAVERRNNDERSMNWIGFKRAKEKFTKKSA